jgi:hypothetical protein
MIGDESRMKVGRQNIYVATNILANVFEINYTDLFKTFAALRTAGAESGLRSTEACDKSDSQSLRQENIKTRCLIVENFVLFRN